MIDKFKKSFQQAGDFIKDQANTISDSAKEKTYQVIDDWMEVFPELETYGWETTSFGLNLALSPSLEVELRGNRADFTLEKVNLILEKTSNQRILNSIFKSVQTTLQMHKKIKSNQYEYIFLLINVKIPPEVKVVLGERKLY